MDKYLFQIFLFLIPFLTNGQRTCATMDLHSNLLETYPEYEQNIKNIAQHTQQILRKKASERNSAIITIPVVFHIVYNSSVQNVSDAQISSQLEILNEDFRRINTDAVNTPADFISVAADVEIEFCFASVDPFGNATNGITRTATSVLSFSQSEGVKNTHSGGIDAWPSSEYLNIWVCNLTGGLLGYAQFPGGPPATDGVVIDYAYFGNIGSATPPFHLGRTTTHEVGHWLNLRHIWGDGNCDVDDFVSDTPIAIKPNRTKSPCSYPGPDSCEEGTGDLPDMFQNYMDYSDDECMNLFTLGQKARMRALFEPGGNKFTFLSSNGCGIPNLESCADGYQNGSEVGIDCGGTLCDPCNSLMLTINFDDFPSETSWSIKDDNGNVVEYKGLYSNYSPQSTVSEIIYLKNGCYVFSIYDLIEDGICCSSGNGSYTLFYKGELIAAGGDFGASEATSFCVNNIYEFLGTQNTSWSNPNNWDTGSVPDPLYEGRIIISADCDVVGIDPFTLNSELIIKSGVTLTCDQ